MRKKTQLEQILIERHWRLFGKYYDITTQAKTKNTHCYEYIHIGCDGFTDNNHGGFNWHIYLDKNRNKIKGFDLECGGIRKEERFNYSNLPFLVGAYNGFIAEIKSICEEAKEKFGIDAYPLVGLLKFIREDGKDCTLEEMRREAEEEENDL